MEQSLKFTCDECDIRFSESPLLNDHLKTTHRSETEKQTPGKPRGVSPRENQHNCNDCSFQGYSKIELEQHLKTTHHGPSEANKLNCHTCAKTFISKRDLMKHRKASHNDIIRKCRFFADGGCEFENGVCWFRHDNEVEQTRTSKTQDLNHVFKCRFCEKTFQEKSVFMLHRKKDHQRVVKQCRNFIEDGCSFTDEECWYKHSENRHEKSLAENCSSTKPSNEEEQASVFWKAPMNTPPDDLMRSEVRYNADIICSELESELKFGDNSKHLKIQRTLVSLLLFGVKRSFKLTNLRVDKNKWGIARFLSIKPLKWKTF